MTDSVFIPFSIAKSRKNLKNDTRGVFRSQPSVFDGVFFAKIGNGYHKKSFTVGV